MSSSLSVRALEATITRPEAEKRLAPAFFSGRLRAIAQVSIPYYLFSVSIRDGARRTRDGFAMDAVTGDLDLLHLDPAETDRFVVRPRARNDLPAMLSESAAAELVREKVRRLMYRQGFFKLRNPEIEPTAASQVMVPYWVGFLGDDERMSLRVIDAIGGRVEGAKVRQLIEWALSREEERPLLSSGASGFH